MAIFGAIFIIGRSLDESSDSTAEARLSFRDPRVPFAILLIGYLVIGISYLGFNRSIDQIAVIVGAAVVFELVLHAVFKKPKLFFPLSALISGLGLAILLNFSHSVWVGVWPVFFAMASKYIFTFEDRHVYNPSLFGVVMSLFLTNGLVSSAPSYQWGGALVVSVFVVLAALILFVQKINRHALIISFLVFYSLATALRAYIARDVIPPETLFLGALTAPAFFLFAFFMFTDPATSPKTTRGQIYASLAVVTVDFILHMGQVLETIFYAAFIVTTIKFLFLHGRRLWRARRLWDERLLFGARRAATLSLICLVVHVVSFSVSEAAGRHKVQFQLRKVDSGLMGRPSPLTSEVDPRVLNVGKWLLSIGDAAAVGDFDNDGLLDIFVTNSLKAPEDRGTLYRNLGHLKFEKVDLPALESIRRDPYHKGFFGGAIWLDYDNDGDQDLLVLVGYGQTRLLENQLIPSGHATFKDVTDTVGPFGYTISVGANVLDFDRDGRLDIVIGNAFETELPGYDQPTPFNAFQLPAPQYAGDRRMFNFMHRTWHDAENGGGVFFFKNENGHYRKIPNDVIGISDRRWSLDIGTGDFDQDGFVDLYVANDFGPDQLLLNEHGQKFREVKGRLVGELGRDTYKGMNASISDFDNNGFPDVYVSNVHETLQTEGSLLWMNDGQVRSKGYKAFRDEATGRNALNERRFGWGAGVGDLNRDGRLDIVQSNGYLDDRYDHMYEGCPDYWYWNGLVALSPPEIHGFADNWADLRGRCFFPYEVNRVYLNLGSKFVDVADEVGFTEKNAARGMAVADLDNDGDLDVIVTGMTQPPTVYENLSLNDNDWMGLKMEGNGTSCNRDALGTKVRVLGQYREVQAKNGLSSQHDRRLFFGLGERAPGPVTVEVNWCGDASVERYELESKKYHKIVQGLGVEN